MYRRPAHYPGVGKLPFGIKKGPGWTKMPGVGQFPALQCIQFMKTSKRSLIFLVNLMLVALLYGLVTLNKAIFRPMFQADSFPDILTGIFPNFIAALLISLAFICPVLIRRPPHGSLIAYASAVAVFAVLATEEFKPMWGASTYFDPYDIAASAAGSLASVLVYELIKTSENP